MAVLFAWNQRPKDRISYESLKLATELPDTELRRTLWVMFLWQRIFVKYECFHGYILW